MANCDFLHCQTPFAKAGKQLSFIPNILLTINGNIVCLPTLNLLFFMGRQKLQKSNFDRTKLFTNSGNGFNIRQYNNLLQKAMLI
ncbi:hypothetical protein NC651_030897 [Populus alba x Populus x berolinensis]|nr:hypothetical protein NC651_030897 [Populus alba x Populus x berolinensis]